MIGRKRTYTQVYKSVLFNLLCLVAMLLCIDYNSGNFISTGGEVILSLNIMAGSVNGRFSKIIGNRLEVLSVLINNFCNLKCKHCYLQAKKETDYLSSEEWHRFFRSVFLYTKPGTVSFAGKEVFFDDQSASVFFDTIQLRNEMQSAGSRRTEIGVITNGTLIDRFKNRLLEFPPDYMDISIDGLPEIHNQIRGEGSFEMLEENLKWLTKEYNGNIWVTHTVVNRNIDKLPEFIKYIHNSYGLRRFSIGLYKQRSFTDASLGISRKDVSALFRSLIEDLSTLKPDAHIEVILELDLTQSEFISELENSGIIEQNEALSSAVFNLENGICLKINVARIPVGLWRCVRVTPEGFWLAAEDLMEVKDYKKVAVTTLREHNFDSKSLTRAGLYSDRKQELAEQAPVEFRHYLDTSKASVI